MVCCLPLFSLAAEADGIVSVLAYLHDHALMLHRDISPSNIMVVKQEGQPHALLIDFDYATSLTGDLQAVPPGTRTVGLFPWSCCNVVFTIIL